MFFGENKRRCGVGLVALSLALSVYGCGDDDASSTVDGGTMSGSDGGSTSGDASQTSSNIVEVATAAGDFSTLLSALERTGLDDALAGAGPFTVFAPTDAAFEALGVDLSTLTDEQLTTILQYHVISGERVASSAIPDTADTLADLTLVFSTEGSVSVNDATVTMADVDASNGVIHIIDAVLTPPNIVEMATIAGLTGLTGAVGAASGNLGDVLSGDGPFTVFAPTNQAFDDAAAVAATLSDDQLRDVLLFHVVSGAVLSTALTDGEVDSQLSGQTLTIDLSSGVEVEDATVVGADIKVTNGVIHLIDAVMVPPSLS